MKINGVIFDMDGVITDSETYARIAMKKLMHEEYHYDNYTDAEYNQLVGINHAYATKVLGRFTGDEQLACQILNTFQQRLYHGYDLHAIHFKTGAMELINYLNDHQIPICLATSSAYEKVEMSFHSNGVEVPFRYVVTGHDVTRSKPDPEIFLKAAAKIGVDIHECLVIEDSHQGMQAAIASGAYSCMVPDALPANEYEKANATYIKKDLLEVLELIKEYVNP